MFTVNRKDAGSKYIDTEGTHVVSISKVEGMLDNKGREVAKVTFKRHDGATIQDRFLNQENAWWRINSLVASTDHNVPDGTTVDFLGVKGSFLEFITAMTGLELAVTTKFREYVSSTGENKKILEVRQFKTAKVENTNLDGEEDAGNAVPW